MNQKQRNWLLSKDGKKQIGRNKGGVNNSECIFQYSFDFWKHVKVPYTKKLKIQSTKLEGKN